MATATAKKEIEYRAVEVDKGYTLNLSKEEAEVIRDVFAKIGGTPSSRRSLTSGIKRALVDAGLSPNWDVSDMVGVGIEFRSV